MSTPKFAFELERITLRVEQILPIRIVKEPHKTFTRYKAMVETMRTQGLIEPLVVFPQRAGSYLLLDGHLRLAAIKEVGIKFVECIVATDDESFTYNAKVNRVAPVQEHRMILQAISSGVPAEKIASGLNRSVEAIQANAQLLVGIDPETVEIIKDKRISHGAIRILKRVTPVRQVEMAQLMCAVNNFAESYARALMVNTPMEFLTEPEKRRRQANPRPEELEQVEKEIQGMLGDFKTAEETHGERVLHFSFMRGYVRKLLENAKLVRFLSVNYSDILAQFEDIAATESLMTV